MRRPNKWDGPMSDIASTCERLVREAMIEHGVKKPHARQIIARDAQIRPGTLENVSRGRLVNVVGLTDKINAYLIRKIERKISELEHELATRRLIARRPDEANVLRAQAALDEAKRLIQK